MPAVSDVELEDFINETLEILTDLCRSCSDLRGSETNEAGLRQIELGLHTIKGNAASFGFEDLSSVALSLLDALRASSGKSDESETSKVAPLVLEFVTRSRQYLGLVRDDSKPQRFLGGIFKALRDQLDETRQRGLGASDQEQGAPGEPGLGDEIRKILENAPPVRPNVAQLSRIAAKRLKHGGSQGSDGARRGRKAAAEPPQPAAKEKPVRSKGGRRETASKRAEKAAAKALSRLAGRRAHSAPPVQSQGDRMAAEVLGFAFEALCVHEVAVALKAELSENPRLSRRLLRIADFLTTFSRWALSGRMVSLDEFLGRAAEEVRELAKRSGIDLEINTGAGDVFVLPALGQFVQHALVEVLRGLIVYSRELSETKLAVTLSATSGASGVQIRVSGAQIPRGSAAGLRIYPVRRRLREIGGDLETVDDDQDLVVTVPDNFQSIDVLLVKAGSTLVGIPGHRVIETTNVQRSDLEWDGARCRYRGSIPIVDLTDWSMLAEPDADSGEHYVVVLRGDTGEARKHGLLVDEVMRQEEMLVLLNPRVYHGEEILGFCLGENYERSVPVFDFHVR